MKPLAYCLACPSDEPCANGLCEFCQHVEERAARCEPGCRCSLHDKVARLASERARMARRAARAMRSASEVVL